MGGFEVGPQGSHNQQRLLILAVDDLHHGAGQVLVAQHYPQLQQVSGGLFPIPCVNRLVVSLIHGDPAHQRVQVGQETLAVRPLKPLPQGLQMLYGPVRLPLVDPQPHQQADQGKFNVRGPFLLNFFQTAQQVQHPPGYFLALFKFTLRDGALRERHAVPFQQETHRDTVLAVEIVILSAPRTEVLAAVHNAGQTAGDRKLRHDDLLAGQQAYNIGELGQNVAHTPLGQSDVQIGQPAPNRFVVRVRPFQPSGAAFQFQIPRLGSVIIHADGRKHTHPRHQRRRGQYLLPGQGAVVVLHLVIVGEAGMNFTVLNQQFGHLLILPAAGVAVQGIFIVVVQFIIEGGSAIEPVLFLGAIFPFLLPKEELPEHRPEVAAVEIVIAEHGRVLLQFTQQLPGAAVSGENPGELHVKGFKGG